MKDSSTRLDLVLLAAIVGILGGFLGALVVVLFFLPSRSSDTPPTIIGSRTSEIKIDEIAVLASRAIVAWYPASRAGKENLSSEDMAAFGVVLTADGWLLGPSPAAKGGLVPVVDRARLTVTKIVTDPWTGLVFVKTNGSNLNVVSFREDAPHLGETVLTPLQNRGFAPSFLSSVRATSRYPQSVFTSVYALLEDRDDGAPVFDRDGKVVGLVASSHGPGRVVPATHLAAAIRSVLRTGTVARPEIGVLVQDLSRVPISRDLLRGARVTLVQPKTPAAKAGLVPNDTIMAVNDQSVDASHDLYELVAAYDPGTAVRLEIIRNGKTMMIPVTLGQTDT